MVKLMFALRRLPTLSSAEFHEYWYETHGPLVRKHAEKLKIRRYVQTHTMEDSLNAVLRQSRGAEDAYDGVAELWWQSRDELEKTLTSAEGREAARILLEDEKKFIDLGRSALWIAEERPIIG
jgi:uncharacterized protein (TIGR02118 family)